MRWHHAPDRAESHRNLVAAVHLGDVVAHRVGAGGSGRPGADPPNPSPAALVALGVDECVLEETIEKTRQLEIDPREFVNTLGR